MGVDIHMFVVKENKELADIGDKVLDGMRNYEWFDELSGRGERPEYDILDSLMNYGIPKEATDEIKEYDNEMGYYGFRYINVGKLIGWYNECKPYVMFGYIPTIMYHNLVEKNITPNSDDIIYDPENEDINSGKVVFARIPTNDPFDEIIDYIRKENIPSDATLVLFFDH